MTEVYQRNFKGIWIPKEIWESKDLSIMEKLFLVEIDSLDNEEGCFASNKYFSEFFDVSKGRCSQIIKSLEEKGLIKIEYEYEGKEIKKRTIKVFNKLNTLVNFLNDPIKNIKGGYLENAKDNNTYINNTYINNNNIVSDKPDTVPYQEIIDYLNLKANKKFKSTSKDTQKHIKARIKEGFMLDDFKKVIDNKVNDWLNDSKFNEYLRPSTLFGTKFESYLNSDNQSKKVVSFNNTNRFNRPKKQEQVPYWANQQASNNHQMQQTSIESEEAIRDRMKNLLRSKDEEG